MNKKEAIKIIEAYYKRIGRDKYPNLQSYKIKELKKVLLMFDL
jgi:hypothetical protein